MWRKRLPLDLMQHINKSNTWFKNFKKLKWNEQKEKNKNRQLSIQSLSDCFHARWTEIPAECYRVQLHPISLMQTYAHAEWWQIFNTVMSYVVVLRASDHMCMKNCFDCARQSSTFMGSPHMYAFIPVCHVMWCLLFSLRLWKWVNLNCYRTVLHSVRGSLHVCSCSCGQAYNQIRARCPVVTLQQSRLYFDWKNSSANTFLKTEISGNV